MVSDGSAVAAAYSPSSGKADEARTESPELFDSFLASDAAETELLGFDEAEEARFGLDCMSSESFELLLVSGVAETEHLGSIEPEEARFGSVYTTEHGENLVRDPRLFLQEHSGNIVKKWGDTEQWVLELRNGRRVTVPVQIALPRCEVIEVLEKQQQLALVMLESSEEEDEVSVEDGASIPSRMKLVSPLWLNLLLFLFLQTRQNSLL